MNSYDINDESVQEAIFYFVDANLFDYYLECVDNYDLKLIDYAVIRFSDFQKFCIAEYGFQVTM